MTILSSVKVEKPDFSLDITEVQFAGFSKELLGLFYSEKPTVANTNNGIVLRDCNFFLDKFYKHITAKKELLGLKIQVNEARKDLSSTSTRPETDLIFFKLQEQQETINKILIVSKKAFEEFKSFVDTGYATTAIQTNRLQRKIPLLSESILTVEEYRSGYQIFVRTEEIQKALYQKFKDELKTPFVCMSSFNAEYRGYCIEVYQSNTKKLFEDFLKNDLN